MINVDRCHDRGIVNVMCVIDVWRGETRRMPGEVRLGKLGSMFEAKMKLTFFFALEQSFCPDTQNHPSASYPVIHPVLNQFRPSRHPLLPNNAGGRGEDADI